MSIDPIGDTQRQCTERLPGAGAPRSADVQRALALAVKGACAKFVNTEQERPLAWIVRDAARRLAEAGFVPEEISARLRWALQPQYADMLDGEFVQIPDAGAETKQEAEPAPGTGI